MYSTDSTAVLKHPQDDRIRRPTIYQLLKPCRSAYTASSTRCTLHSAQSTTFTKFSHNSFVKGFATPPLFFIRLIPSPTLHLPSSLTSCLSNCHSLCMSLHLALTRLSLSNSVSLSPKQSFQYIMRIYMAPSIHIAQARVRRCSKSAAGAACFSNQKPKILVNQREPLEQFKDTSFGLLPQNLIESCYLFEAADVCSVRSSLINRQQVS